MTLPFFGACGAATAGDEGTIRFPETIRGFCGPERHTAREEGQTMRGRTTAGLSVALGLWLGVAGARADDGDWRPTSAPPAVVRAREVIASTRPAVTLGRPVAVAAPAPVVQTAHMAPDEPSAGADLQPKFRGQAPDSVPPPATGGSVPPPPPPGNPIYENGAVTQPPAPGFGSKCWDFLKDSSHRRGGQLFQSDHAGDLDQFASPVSSPFLTEDPRALTEVKPLFIYQTIPGRNPLTGGGSIEFFGVQARLALTERWSIVVNKLGGIAIQPDDKTFIGDESGFSEVWLGPKLTFYRDDCNNTVAAAGLTFQIPTGSSKVFQDTGTLSIAPYLSFAKTFGKIPNGFGNFNFMSTTGFAVRIDSERSNYFYTNLHLDFDVGGQHRFYPLIELNWTRYLNNGHAQPFFNFEGGDLVNFGSGDVSSHSLVTLATGARYKLGGRENVQFGAAFEFPLTNQRDLQDFRFTFDVIFRY